MRIHSEQDQNQTVLEKKNKGCLIVKQKKTTAKSDSVFFVMAFKAISM